MVNGGVYLDSGILIRMVEVKSNAHIAVQARLANVPWKRTSVISRIECLMLPIRANDRDTLRLFQTTFSAPDLDVLEVDDEIAKQATIIRAKFNLKVPDAIHLATATVAACDAFLTTDRDFKKCVGWTGCPIEFLPSI